MQLHHLHRSPYRRNFYIRSRVIYTIYSMPFDWKKDYPDPALNATVDSNDVIREEDVLQKIECSQLYYDDTTAKCFLLYTFL